jgi:hypothetical protein
LQTICYLSDHCHGSGEYFYLSNRYLSIINVCYAVSVHWLFNHFGFCWWTQGGLEPGGVYNLRHNEVLVFSCLPQKTNKGERFNRLMTLVVYRDMGRLWSVRILVEFQQADNFAEVWIFNGRCLASHLNTKHFECALIFEHFCSNNPML